MIEKQCWEASIGRKYRTRGGDVVSIQGASDAHVIIRFDNGALGTLDLSGCDEIRHQWDLMEMVRSSNADGLASVNSPASVKS